MEALIFFLCYGVGVSAMLYSFPSILYYFFGIIMCMIVMGGREIHSFKKMVIVPLSLSVFSTSIYSMFEGVTFNHSQYILYIIPVMWIVYWIKKENEGKMFSPFEHTIKLCMAAISTVSIFFLLSFVFEKKEVVSILFFVCYIGILFYFKYSMKSKFFVIMFVLTQGATFFYLNQFAYSFTIYEKSIFLFYIVVFLFVSINHKQTAKTTFKQVQVSRA